MIGGNGFGIRAQTYPEFHFDPPSICHSFLYRTQHRAKPELFLMIGNHLNVIVSLCQLLDFGCGPGIIRVKLYRIGGGSRLYGNRN